MKELKYSRWHRYDKNNIKYIVRCELDKHPEPLQEENYTEWCRGTGPHSEIGYQNVVSGIRKACSGVAKTPETKHKMSVAKLGKPKTPEHKKAMSLSHRLRQKAKEDDNESNCKFL
jgi:hypothetical protein